MTIQMVGPMVSPQTVVVTQAQPDLTLEAFTAILESASSPSAPYAGDAYNILVKVGISPAYALAQFNEESGMGTAGLAVKSLNPGNVRSSVSGLGTVVPSATQGPFVYFNSWADGWKEYAAHLTAPNSVYAKEGRTTISQIITRWAPSSDGNQTNKYINDVCLWMNKWIGNGNTMDIIDLSANTPSSVYSDRKGFTVQELILHDTSGSGDFNNKSDNELQALLNATIHWFQGSGGVSIHYLIGPENLGGKIYRLCKEAVAAYHAVGNKGSIGGVSKDNLISIGIERFGQPNESVGLNQRNAMLWLVSDICHRYSLSANQVISHMSIQSDRRDGGVLLETARQVVINGGLNYVTNQNNPPIPAPDTVVINGKTLGGGFRGFYDKLAGVSPNFQLLVLGLPTTNEFDCDINKDGKKFTVQLFERAGLVYESANAAPWDVHLLTTAQLQVALATQAA